MAVAGAQGDGVPGGCAVEIGSRGEGVAPAVLVEAGSGNPRPGRLSARPGGDEAEGLGKRGGGFQPDLG